MLSLQTKEIHANIWRSCVSASSNYMVQSPLANTYCSQNVMQGLYLGITHWLLKLLWACAWWFTGMHTEESCLHRSSWNAFCCRARISFLQRSSPLVTLSLKNASEKKECVLSGVFLGIICFSTRWFCKEFLVKQNIPAVDLFLCVWTWVKVP